MNAPDAAPAPGTALAAARAVAGGQSYPAGALYMVATPIGNLADISLRALHVLQLADAIACEDTRHTQGLLRAYGIERAAAGLIVLHQHNETAAAQQVVQRLRQGQRIAYVSDAGTPAVSDPGARLVQAVQHAGLRVVPLPGASSVTAALSAAGAVQAGLGNGVAGLDGGWVFAGFLPVKARERARAVQELAAERRCVVLFEAPHRVEALARELAALGGRRVTLARELTKQFEDIVTLPAAELDAWLAAERERHRGEFVLVLHALPAPASAEADAALSAEQARTLRVLLDAGLPTREAARIGAELLQLPRKQLYAHALALRAETPPEDSHG